MGEEHDVAAETLGSAIVAEEVKIDPQTSYNNQLIGYCKYKTLRVVLEWTGTS